MNRVLVVEDEVGLCEAVARGLADHGFLVDSTVDGFDGYRKAKEGAFDVVILDWMLPGLAGDEVCRRLRQEGVLTPILMLTAKDGVSDETGALDAGADDYLRKPFEFAVLIARCEALVRRQSRGAWSEIVFGDLALDPRRRLVRIGTDRIALSRRESEVLAYLMRAKGDIRSKEDLLRDVWGLGTGADPNSVEVYAGYLRRKLEPVAGRRVIETVRGAGYRLISP
jgi:two-component system OmpR family response regulator